MKSSFPRDILKLWSLFRKDNRNEIGLVIVIFWFCCLASTSPPLSNSTCPHETEMLWKKLTQPSSLGVMFQPQWLVQEWTCDLHWSTQNEAIISVQHLRWKNLLFFYFHVNEKWSSGSCWWPFHCHKGSSWLRMDPMSEKLIWEVRGGEREKLSPE